MTWMQTEKVFPVAVMQRLGKSWHLHYLAFIVTQHNVTDWLADSQQCH